jgi:ankyrin repeat protein
VKKLLVLSFSVAVIIFEFRQESRPQSKSQALNQATAGRRERIQPAALDSSHQEGQARRVAEAELRAASAKAITLIQHSQMVWCKKETCASCHHQLLPEIAFKLARERGISMDRAIARDSNALAFAFMKDLDAAVQRYDFIDLFFDGWSLVTAHAAGIKANLATAVYAQFIASRQLADGSWPTIDSRPPQAYSRFTATAVCAQAVRNYLPERSRDERESRLRRAREWLLKGQPLTTEDRAFQLLGLYWTGADGNIRKNAARQIIAQQREDGGWSQLPGMAGDAYSTGEALVALREGAGLSAVDPAYRRGLRFLLKAQEPDGSWHVTSRLHPPAPVSPPYFDTGFPYQHDQFISIMGTTWAASALLEALPFTRETSPVVPPGTERAEQAKWIQAALFGSAADLKRLLDAGMNPNAKTAGGTTALMLAARDLQKVKLLIDRGADVNAHAATGITPLMVAARYNGNVEVVRLLLKRGARPNADKGIEVRNDASALFFAVMAGDAQIAGALLDAGARLGDGMKLVGRVVVSPLMYAVSAGESAIVELLISRGANANEVDGDRISVLEWAAISNRLSVAKVLLPRGGKVNHVDNFGMTPVLYAASVDFGDTAMAERLIAAGADLKAKNNQGLTALDLANNYHHRALANLLAGK